MLNHINTDANEVKKFSELAAQWWDINGPCKPLHIINPVRLNYVLHHVSLVGKKVIDIGCGGGIFSESMAQLGANVTGIDMSEPTLNVARVHYQTKSLNLNYFHTTAEAFAQQHSQQFDVVTCMELLEHVPDPFSLIRACATLVKPNGHIFFSTLNRTSKAYLLAILAAEYTFRLLPKGTHDYARFIKPSELSHWIRDAGLTVTDIKGIGFLPILDKAWLQDDITVNYILHAVS